MIKLFFLVLINLFSKISLLKFNKDHKFTILQFTDLHYGEEDKKDELSQNLQRNLIKIGKKNK